MGLISNDWALAEAVPFEKAGAAAGAAVSNRAAMDTDVRQVRPASAIPRRRQRETTVDCTGGPFG